MLPSSVKEGEEGGAVYDFMFSASGNNHPGARRATPPESGGELPQPHPLLRGIYILSMTAHGQDARSTPWAIEQILPSATSHFGLFAPSNALNRRAFVPMRLI